MLTTLSLIRAFAGLLCVGSFGLFPADDAPLWALLIQPAVLLAGGLLLWACAYLEEVLP